MRKDASKPSNKDAPSQEAAQDDTTQPDTRRQAAPKRSQPRESWLVRQLGPGVANLVFHTALMGLVPFTIFFASISGVFDPLYRVTFGIPDERNKAIPAAILAVLSVQAVIASFVIQAFKEEQAAAKEAKSD